MNLEQPCVGTRRQIVVRDERPQTMRDEDHRATLATSAIDRIGETLLCRAPLSRIGEEGRVGRQGAQM